MNELALKLIAENKARHARGEDARSLDLSLCGLTDIPVELGELGWLEKLYFSNKKANEENVTKKISQFLGVSSKPVANRITHLSNVISGLKNLKVLDVSDNQIANLSPISELLNLEVLICSANIISDLSPIGGLINLEVLSCYSNQIADLSPISDLSNLQILNCFGNQISNLTPLSGLTKLKSLYCFLNPISDLAPILFLIKNNVTIIWGDFIGLFQNGDNLLGKPLILIKDCPLINPPIEIVKQGNEAILEYFRQKEISGAAPLLEAKLILLGDGRSGKTSLANRLLDKPMPTEADRTQGVDIVIGEYAFEVAQQRQFKLNIWDFAGQDKYKPLHQFFYSESSLYVMVADSGNNRTDFDDWLQTAELFGEGSPLIIVLNEFRDGIGFGTFDREIWQKRFPNLLKAVYCVNLDTKKGLDTLEHNIRLLAQSLAHTQHPFPNNWAAIRRELESRRDENFITFNEYLRICRENKLPEKESALILGQVLHKIGVCLHYQKNELLKQVVILKNEWATEAVYKILDDATVAEVNKGFFDRHDLERIWSDEAYCDMRPQLLELMQQFKMAYPLPGGQRFVTPPLLPPVPPQDWTWPEGDDLELYIDYEFLPKGLMTQFIVSRHPDIDRGKTQVWREGVVLRWPEEALAEVQKTKLQGKDAFYIRSQGRDRKGMMTVILKTFRDLHEDYKGIKSEEKVPCPCSGCKTGKNKQHYFDFENLKNRLEKGRDKVECDKSLEELDLIKLLENHFVFEKMRAGQPLLLKKDIHTPQQLDTMMPQPKKVFISYSHKDEDAMKELDKFLEPLERSGKITIWTDRKILAGQPWKQHILKELESADLILLLVTANFLDSDFIHEEEIPRAFKRMDEHGKNVVPIILNYCLWDVTPIKDLQAIPKDGQPIAGFANAAQAWNEVSRSILALL